MSKERIIHEWVEKKENVIPGEEDTLIRDSELALILVMLGLHRKRDDAVKKFQNKKIRSLYRKLSGRDDFPSRSGWEGSMKRATHGLICTITRKRRYGQCSCNPILSCVQKAPLFLQLMGTSCSKVENTNRALDQREIKEICSKKPNICKCFEAFVCGLLKGMTISKVTLEFVMEPRQFVWEKR